MKVEVLQDFRDREHDMKLRVKGEKFEATSKRASYLESLDLVTRIREPVKKTATVPEA